MVTCDLQMRKSTDSIRALKDFANERAHSAVPGTVYGSEDQNNGSMEKGDVARMGIGIGRSPFWVYSAYTKAKTHERGGLTVGFCKSGILLDTGDRHRTLDREAETANRRTNSRRGTGESAVLLALRIDCSTTRPQATGE